MENKNYDLDKLNESNEHLKKHLCDILGTKSTDEFLLIEPTDDGSVKMKDVKEPFKFNLYNIKQRLPGINALLMPAFIVLFALNLLTIVKFGVAMATLDLSITSYGHYIYEIFLILAPMILWAISTNVMEYNYRNGKLVRFIFSYLVINIAVLRLIFITSYKVFIPFVVLIKPKAQMTVAKIEGLGYLSTLIPVGIGLVFLVFLSTKRGILNEYFLEKVVEFRLFKVFDISLKRKDQYVYSVVRDIKSGKLITIPQKDRQMHTAIIGATGTAKTSSCLLPAILSDLKVRAHNKSKLKKYFYEYASKGIFIKIKEFEDQDFRTEYFKPNPNYDLCLKDLITGRTPQRIYDYLIQKYEVSGQTILAPEDSLTDDAAALFELFGENFNRVDPKKKDGKHKSNFKGLNIFYISPDFPKWALEREMVRRSTLLADVMQSMFEMDGKSDPYFASVNRIATTTVSLLLQLTYPKLKNRPPHLLDVMDALNDRNLLLEPFNKLFPNGKINNENLKYRWLKDNLMNYFFGDGAATFEQHSRGLKIQISSFLADDYIRELLTADEVIDFDKMLSDNQLTVVNIELPELGPVNAPALGLFFSINMSNAVLRRPGTENTRSFHTWRIDEFPIIVTPSMEQAFTLFRKFKVAMEVAMQTLDQMDKTPYLKYLKGIILNSTANQIVFGRANVSEMDTYSVLAGTMEDFVKMKGKSMSPIASETQSVSIQERETKTLVNVMEGGDIRNKDFQEVTYFYTMRGSLMPVVHGKVEFIRKNDKKVKKNKCYDWTKIPLSRFDEPNTTEIKEPVSENEPVQNLDKITPTESVNNSQRVKPADGVMDSIPIQPTKASDGKDLIEFDNMITTTEIDETMVLSSMLISNKASSALTLSEEQDEILVEMDSPVGSVEVHVEKNNRNDKFF